MTDWPAGLRIGPIGEWPGARRAPANRERARFLITDPNSDTYRRIPTPLSATTADLRRELQHLNAKDPELLVAIEARHFRQDGFPRANATATDPGVILTFDIPKIGRVSYPCDKYTRWEDNLRAIAKTLESLRLVALHGVVRHNQQYRGFLALEAAVAVPGAFADVESAKKYLVTMAGPDAGYLASMKNVLRLAQMNTHPDRPGGNADDFRRVTLAETKLREAGLL